MLKYANLSRVKKLTKKKKNYKFEVCWLEVRMSGGLINHPFLKKNNHVKSICTKTVGLTMFHVK